MNVLPVALTPKRVLLIGAGRAAAHKARGLLQSDCELEVVAREIRDDFFLGRSVRLCPFALDWLEARQGGDLAYDLVVNATGDAALSIDLWENRRRLRYWLNAADQPDCCDFYFGAMLRDRELCILVSTGGASPTHAQAVRDLVAAVLPRRDAAFYKELRRRRFHPEEGRRAGKVFLIGCGPGGLDNLTVKAIKTLKFLNVALIDARVENEIVDFLPAHCLKIDIGAREEIGASILRHVREGRNVGWLAGSDPALFGESGGFFGHGVEVEIVGGVPEDR